MGNCIDKTRLCVLATRNFRKGSHREHIHGPKNDGVERDHNVIAPHIHRPPPSAKNVRQSHPLPTPNHSSQTALHHESKPNTLPLPKHENPNIQDEASSTSILPMPTSESEILSAPNLKSFSLDQLSRATSDFCEDSLLGEGGFGCVFKGWLDEKTLNATNPSSGLPVAIKKLIHSGFQGHNEWLSEVNYLGRLHHPHLVKLIGYCLEGEDRILVYEFMPGGCLEDLLFSSRNCPALSWERRVQVAVGAARGLSFLHELESPVIYRDFKASNVLLDSDFNAKLSDFGLAKAGPTQSQTHVTTRVMGTEGYCDPRYIATGKLTVKCDVYSFGVVLLELLTGRPAIDETKFEEEKNLVEWARVHLNDKGRVFRMMDTRLEGQYCKRSAFIVANMALRCLNLEPKYRPPMTYILDILQNLPSYKTQH
ncbi:probable serine/threonine-protein kinase PBL18 isoform X2 [Salvia miltiorrhiza]|uniref:probable serine/threonine-protein kinase PBL18 isoform X2 n=1 Tax=Salvia miltiorrhiza TaxID=226208 RepID=UPI0025AC129B|nr:probable serine/threonine-protein kinase PBL18 isoform X2 [Salvia miltiorrhiza]